jgi:hypothetical protein
MLGTINCRARFVVTSRDYLIKRCKESVQIFAPAKTDCTVII